MNSEETGPQGSTTSTAASPVLPTPPFGPDGQISATVQDEAADAVESSVAGCPEVAAGHDTPQNIPLDNEEHHRLPTPDDGSPALAMMEFLEEDRRLRSRQYQEQDDRGTHPDDVSDEISLRPAVPPREYSVGSLNSGRNTDGGSGGLQGRANTNGNMLGVSTPISFDDQRQQPRSNPIQSRRTEIVRARWQPDGEVTYCPICHTQFGWVVRKHHCRKCGRVVCGSCSTHRITIPYEYIARPPIQTSRSSYGGSTSDELSLERTRTGGERVRLCNPCVPDPNVAPPQVPPTSEGLYRRRSERTNYQTSSSAASTGSNASRRENRSSLVFDTFSRRPRVPSIVHSADASQDGTRSRSNTVPTRDAGSMDTGSSIPNRSESSYIPSRGQHLRSVDISRPLPQLPPPSEDDICPVCHRLLPARSMSNYEELRANHIISCIEGHMIDHSSHARPRPGAYTSNSGPPGSIEQSSNAPESSSQPPRRRTPSNASPASSSRPIPNTPEARMAAREQAHAAIVLRASQTPPPDNVRQTRLFPYKATEKDCVDDAECTICLEEFEVGADMARLECFCRFHLHCIREWWVDHHGRCPVHQHDGYGF